MYNNKFFQDLQDNYKISPIKSNWDALWLYVQETLSYSLRKKLKGVYREDYEDLLSKGTLNIMNRYNKDINYSVKYLPALTALVARSLIYNDKPSTISYDYLLEKGLIE